MDMLTAIEQRRSVKHYDPTLRVTDEEIRRRINPPPDHVLVFDGF